MKKYDWSKEIHGDTDTTATIVVLAVLVIMGIVSMFN